MGLKLMNQGTQINRQQKDGGGQVRKMGSQNWEGKAGREIGRGRHRIWGMGRNWDPYGKVGIRSLYKRRLPLSQASQRPKERWSLRNRWKSGGSGAEEHGDVYRTLWAAYLVSIPTPPPPSSFLWGTLGNTVQERSPKLWPSRPQTYRCLTYKPCDHVCLGIQNCLDFRKAIQVCARP